MGEPDRTRRGQRGGRIVTERKRRFEEVVLCHLDLMYRIALRLSGNRTEAEDLVQEALLRAHRAFDRFDLRSYGAKAWLLKILHNVFYTQRSRAGRQPTVLDDVDFDHFASELEQVPLPRLADGLVNWDYFDEELKHAVERLAPEYREVLLLWSLGDVSYKEMAEILDCPLGTVMSRLYRARQSLSQQLAEYAVRRGFVPRGPDE
jgi:RNA polymerase sigma-70 factor (ECF subfamily)